TSSANKKQEYVKYDDKKEDKKVDEKKRDMSKVKCYNCKKEGHFAKDCKKAKVKDYEYYKTKMFLAKKDKDEQVLLAKDHTWMESSSDSDQEINANVVFMSQMEKVLSDSKKSSSSSDDTIIKLIKEFDKKIAKYQKRLEKANQQSKDFENQTKFLQDKCDVLQNQTNIFEVKNNELNKQINVLIEKNDGLLAQMNVLHEQLKVKHVVIDTHTECSKHMTGNRALLTNFIEKFLGTVRFDNNDFAMIASYGDVVIGSMMIKKVYYVEGLGHTYLALDNFVTRVLKSPFENLHVLFKMKMKYSIIFYCKNATQNGVVERRKRTLVEAARTMLTFVNLPLFLWAEAIETTCFTQNHSIIHKHFDKTPYELINKRKPNINFFHVFGCRCYLLNDYDDVRKLKAKGDIGAFVGYFKDSAAFRVYNKQTRKIYESMNVNFDEISKMASKQFGLEPSLSNLIETGKSSNLTVLQVEETLKKDLEDLFHNFYDEYFDASKITKLPTLNVKTSNTEGEGFHEVSESFQGESSSSSINDNVQQSLEETKWTKDHPLHKIISNPESNVHTRGQLANSCLFACLLSSIEPANVAEALKDADWVIAMQDELDQFARLKV
nr:retrovirus-related Pol polyprotein from transposon TNT 1-94 [Tanacetum cinerariifolium]